MLQQDRLIGRFMEYAAIDSESLKEGVFAKRLMRELEALGAAKVCTDSSAAKTGSDTGNIYAYFEGAEGAEPLLFSAHMDTVIPGKGVRPRVEGDYVVTDGTTVLGGDDKAGIAAVMECIATIREKELAHRPLECVFTVGEEIGLLGSIHLDYDLVRSRQAVIIDCSGPAGKVIVQGPSMFTLDVQIKGRASHAGTAPEKGVSAIVVAAEAISNMKLLRVDEDTTANVADLSAPGPTNIVTEHLRFKAEARSLTDEKARAQVDHMTDCLEAAAKRHGAELTYAAERSYTGFSLDRDDPLIALVSEKSRKVGMEPVITHSTGGFDAHHFNEHGVRALVLSNGSENVHSTGERLCIPELMKCAGLVLELMLV